MLRKTIVLPAAVEENLRQALAYDLDRHTPFKPEELYFDAAVVERDPRAGKIRVDLAAARRAQSSTPAVAHAAGWGATVVAVVAGRPAGAPRRRALNLLPRGARDGTRFARRWQFWVPLALLAAVALVAVVLPLWQKREYAIALNEHRRRRRVQQARGVGVRCARSSSAQVGDYNFALERKYAYPGRLQRARGRDAGCCPTTRGSRSSR